MCLKLFESETFEGKKKVIISVVEVSHKKLFR